MKKSIVFFLASAGLLLSSCGANKKEQVKEFAGKFAEAANRGSGEELKQLYPTADFDSIVNISAEAIEVLDKGDDKSFQVYYSPTQWIDVEIAEDGMIYISNSKGIAAFPESEMDFAESTGMDKAVNSDSELQQALNDETFRNWLKDRALTESNSALTLTEGASSHKKKMMWSDYGYYDEMMQGQLVVNITNNSVKTIDGSDYSISYTDKHWECCDVEGFGYTKKTASGKTVGPGETVSVTLTTAFTEFWNGDNIEPRVTSPSIKMKLSADKAAANYMPKGTEYQEYLDSKK